MDYPEVARVVQNLRKLGNIWREEKGKEGASKKADTECLILWQHMEDRKG
jgi:hypothetical protein